MCRGSWRFESKTTRFARWPDTRRLERPRGPQNGSPLLLDKSGLKPDRWPSTEVAHPHPEPEAHAGTARNCATDADGQSRNVPSCAPGSCGVDSQRRAESASIWLLQRAPATSYVGVTLRSNEINSCTPVITGVSGSAARPQKASSDTSADRSPCLLRTCRRTDPGSGRLPSSSAAKEPSSVWTTASTR